MPAKSEKQRRFFGAELARKRSGQKTKTGMTEGQLKDYATKGKGKIPAVAKKGRPHGSGTFTDEDLKRGYKKGSPINMADLKTRDLLGKDAPIQVDGLDSTRGVGN